MCGPAFFDFGVEEFQNGVLGGFFGVFGGEWVGWGGELDFEGGYGVEFEGEVFADAGVSPQRFELELTESALMQPSAEIEAQFTRLRRLGIGLALDDFGTGYSSLVYLKRLPITRLKIDRSFVQDLPGDAEDAAIATATLSIARDLGLEVVAEGVETEAQRDFLLQRQCPIMQGYLFARPLRAADITALLAASAEVGASLKV